MSYLQALHEASPAAGIAEANFVYYRTVFGPEPSASILAVSILLPALAGLSSRRLRRVQGWASDSGRNPIEISNQT